MEIMSIKGGGRGGVRRLVENSILNFHFRFWNPSITLFLIDARTRDHAFCTQRTGLCSICSCQHVLEVFP